MIRIDHLLSGDIRGGDPRLKELLIDNGVNDSGLGMEHTVGKGDSPVKRVGSPASSRSHKEEQSVHAEPRTLRCRMQRGGTRRSSGRSSV